MPEILNTFTQTNLLALSTGNNQLASILTYTNESKKIVIKESRSKKLIPFITKKGRIIPLHSQYDPEKEGERFFYNFNNPGYIVFLGFGAGYHIKPFLKNKQISEILIIDKDKTIFKTIIHYFNLTELFLDKRIKLLIDPEPEEVSDFLLKNYFPAISGNLHILKLRARTETETSFFPKIIQTITQTISPLSEDFSVQSYFGKRWFVNTLNNLAAAETATTTIPPIKKALIIGAGPSLELQLTEIKKHAKDCYIISTDTAFPALMKFNIKPDLILSIDCQHITYFHFLEEIPNDIPLVIDLASPRNMTRLTKNLMFFTSGHPFSQYAESRWRSFPSIDTSGGNVSHAAVSLAYSLGARQIYLSGVDFSYPKGKSYARGTYLYPFFNSKSNRLNTVENYFVSFLFYNDYLEHVKDKTGMRYVTKPMISYKKRLEALIEGLDSEVIQITGEGEKIYIKKKISTSKEKNSRLPSIFSSGPAESTWKEFLKEYDNSLRDLPYPGDSLSNYMNSLSSQQKEICMTILPAAAAIRKEFPTINSGEEVLKATINWTRSTIRKFL